MGDPCLPDGDIGVIDDVIAEPCIKLKNLTSLINNNLQSLKNTLNQPGENGLLFNKDSNNSTNNTIVPSSYGRSITIKLNNLSYGFIHTHPFSAVPMFSWGDVLTLSQVYQNAESFNKDDVTVMLLAKSDDGLSNVLYAMTFTNPELFNDLMNQAVNQEDFIGCSASEKANILGQSTKDRFDNESSSYEMDFLREFYDYGVNLWNANSDFSSWSKLSLNPYNMSLIETPCN